LGRGGQPIRFLPEADLLFSIGSSLLKTLGSCALPASVPIVQASADPDDLAIEYPIACGLVGDAKLVLGQLCVEVRRWSGPPPLSWGGAAERKVAEMREQALDEWRPLLESDERPINPYRVIGELMKVLDPDATIITHDSGYPRDQLAPFYVSTVPRGYLGWGNTTPLGGSLRLALGAKVAAPDKVVVNLMGDAAFGQSGLDIETGVRHGIPILTVVLNNYEMGNYEKMQPVAQERYGIKRMSGEFAPVARALGVFAERVDDPGEVGPALGRALAEVRAGRSALVEVITRAEPSVLQI
jgi:acetolactate synthase-1/2/3 large subunit